VLVRADGVDQDVPLTDKRSIARAVLDAVVALRTAAAPDLLDPGAGGRAPTDPAAGKEHA